MDMDTAPPSAKYNFPSSHVMGDQQIQLHHLDSPWSPAKGVVPAPKDSLPLHTVGLQDPVPTHYMVQSPTQSRDDPDGSVSRGERRRPPQVPITRRRESAQPLQSFLPQPRGSIVHTPAPTRHGRSGNSAKHHHAPAQRASVRATTHQGPSHAVVYSPPSSPSHKSRYHNVRRSRKDSRGGSDSEGSGIPATSPRSGGFVARLKFGRRVSRGAEVTSTKVGHATTVAPSPTNRWSPRSPARSPARTPLSPQAQQAASVAAGDELRAAIANKKQLSRPSSSQSPMRKQRMSAPSSPILPLEDGLGEFRDSIRRPGDPSRRARENKSRVSLGALLEMGSPNHHHQNAGTPHQQQQLSLPLPSQRMDTAHSGYTSTGYTTNTDYESDGSLSGGWQSEDQHWYKLTPPHQRKAIGRQRSAPEAAKDIEAGQGGKRYHDSSRRADAGESSVDQRRSQTLSDSGWDTAQRMSYSQTSTPDAAHGNDHRVSPTAGFVNRTRPSSQHRPSPRQQSKKLPVYPASRAAATTPPLQNSIRTKHVLSSQASADSVERHTRTRGMRSRSSSREKLSSAGHISQGNLSQDSASQGSVGSPSRAERKGRSVVSGSIARRKKFRRSSLRKIGAIEGKRRFILAEVQETERDYVTDLSTIIQGYKHPLIGVLSDSDIQSVFGNLEDLYKFHKQFLKKLRQLLATKPQHFGQIFMEMGDKFIMYTDYYTNHPNAIETLHRLRQNAGVQTVLSDLQQRLGHKLPLADYLLKPVQRLLKYPLFLQEMLKNTDPAEDGYRKLEIADSNMKDIAKRINEVKANMEFVADLDACVVGWTGLPLTKLGRLIEQGEVYVSDDTSSKQSLRNVLLFERGIVIFKWKNATDVTIKRMLMIDEVRVVKKLDDDKKYFSLMLLSGVLLTFSFENSEEMLFWKLQMQGACNMAIKQRFKSNALRAEWEKTRRDAKRPRVQKKLKKRRSQIKLPPRTRRETVEQLAAAVNSDLKDLNVSTVHTAEMHVVKKPTSNEYALSRKLSAQDSQGMCSEYDSDGHMATGLDSNYSTFTWTSNPFQQSSPSSVAKTDASVASNRLLEAQPMAFNVGDDRCCVRVSLPDGSTTTVAVNKAATVGDALGRHLSKRGFAPESHHIVAQSTGAPIRWSDAVDSTLWHHRVVSVAPGALLSSTSSLGTAETQPKDISESGEEGAARKTWQQLASKLGSTSPTPTTRSRHKSMMWESMFEADAAGISRKLSMSNRPVSREKGSSVVPSQSPRDRTAPVRPKVGKLALQWPPQPPRVQSQPIHDVAVPARPLKKAKAPFNAFQAQPVARRELAKQEQQELHRRQEQEQEQDKDEGENKDASSVATSLATMREKTVSNASVFTQLRKALTANDVEVGADEQEEAGREEDEEGDEGGMEVQATSVALKRAKFSINGGEGLQESKSRKTTSPTQTVVSNAATTATILPHPSPATTGKPKMAPPAPPGRRRAHLISRFPAITTLGTRQPAQSAEARDAYHKSDEDLSGSISDEDAQQTAATSSSPPQRKRFGRDRRFVRQFSSPAERHNTSGGEYDSDSSTAMHPMAIVPRAHGLSQSLEDACRENRASSNVLNDVDSRRSAFALTDPVREETLDIDRAVLPKRSMGDALNFLLYDAGKSNGTSTASLLSRGAESPSYLDVGDSDSEALTCYAGRASLSKQERDAPEGDWRQSSRRQSSAASDGRNGPVERFSRESSNLGDISSVEVERRGDDSQNNMLERPVFLKDISGSLAQRRQSSNASSRSGSNAAMSLSSSRRASGAPTSHRSSSDGNDSWNDGYDAVTDELEFDDTELYSPQHDYFLSAEGNNTMTSTISKNDSFSDGFYLHSNPFNIKHMYFSSASTLFDDARSEGSIGSLEESADDVFKAEGDEDDDGREGIIQQPSCSDDVPMSASERPAREEVDALIRSSSPIVHLPSHEPTTSVITASFSKARQAGNLWWQPISEASHAPTPTQQHQHQPASTTSAESTTSEALESILYDHGAMTMRRPNKAHMAGDLIKNLARKTHSSEDSLPGIRDTSGNDDGDSGGLGYDNAFVYDNTVVQEHDAYDAACDQDTDDNGDCDRDDGEGVDSTTDVMDAPAAVDEVCSEKSEAKEKSSLAETGHAVIPVVSQEGSRDNHSLASAVKARTVSGDAKPVESGLATTSEASSPLGRQRLQAGRTAMKVITMNRRRSSTANSAPQSPASRRMVVSRFRAKPPVQPKPEHLLGRRLSSEVTSALHARTPPLSPALSPREYQALLAKATLLDDTPTELVPQGGDPFTDTDASAAEEESATHVSLEQVNATGTGEEISAVGSCRGSVLESSVAGARGEEDEEEDDGVEEMNDGEDSPDELEGDDFLSVAFLKTLENAPMDVLADLLGRPKSGSVQSGDSIVLEEEEDGMSTLSECGEGDDESPVDVDVDDDVDVDVDVEHGDEEPIEMTIEEQSNLLSPRSLSPKTVCHTNAPSPYPGQFRQASSDLPYFEKTSLPSMPDDEEVPEVRRRLERAVSVEGQMLASSGDTRTDFDDTTTPSSMSLKNRFGAGMVARVQPASESSNCVVGAHDRGCNTAVLEEPMSSPPIVRKRSSIPLLAVRASARGSEERVVQPPASPDSSSKGPTFVGEVKITECSAKDDGEKKEGEAEEKAEGEKEEEEEEEGGIHAFFHNNPFLVRNRELTSPVSSRRASQDHLQPSKLPTRHASSVSMKPDTPASVSVEPRLDLSFLSTKERPMVAATKSASSKQLPVARSESFHADSAAADEARTLRCASTASSCISVRDRIRQLNSQASSPCRSRVNTDSSSTSSASQQAPSLSAPMPTSPNKSISHISPARSNASTQPVHHSPLSRSSSGHQLTTAKGAVAAEAIVVGEGEQQPLARNGAHRVARRTVSKVDATCRVVADAHASDQRCSPRGDNPTSPSPPSSTAGMSVRDLAKRFSQFTERKSQPQYASHVASTTARGAGVVANRHLLQGQREADSVEKSQETPASRPRPVVVRSSRLADRIAMFSKSPF